MRLMKLADEGRIRLIACESGPKRSVSRWRWGVGRTARSTYIQPWSNIELAEACKGGEGRKGDDKK